MTSTTDDDAAWLAFLAAASTSRDVESGLDVMVQVGAHAAAGCAAAQGFFDAFGKLDGVRPKLPNGGAAAAPSDERPGSTDGCATGGGGGGSSGGSSGSGSSSGGSSDSGGTPIARGATCHAEHSES